MAEDAQAPAQRRWRSPCPNCGAPVEFASPASSSAVCSFCRSTLLRKDDELLRTGESSELFADYSPLQIGTQGALQGEPFTILGRVQLAYEGGSWNEWHAFFEASGKSAWLAEDNGRFVLSWPQSDDALPGRDELILDSQQLIAGRAWRVASLQACTLHAAEGELPEAPRLGEAVLVAELRSAQDEVGSLEYVEGAPVPRWSVGRAVELAALKLSNVREESVAGVGGRSIECPNCGSPIQPQLDQSQSVSCGQCQAVVQLGQTGQALSFHKQQLGGGDPPIALGRSGQLALELGGARLPWQIVGFLQRQTSEDGETFPWREYLLFNREQGFAFLVDSSEGWSLVRTLTGSPQMVGSTARWQGKNFRLKERYTATTTRVLGEFYWRLQRNEQGEVADFEGPGGEILGREQSRNEVTWSQGRKLDATEVMAAFGMNSAMRRAAADVNPVNLGDSLKGILIFLLVAMLLVGFVKACSDDDCDPVRRGFGEQSLEYQQCLAGQRSSSGSFRVPSGGGGGGGWGGGGHK
ncbi:DUF4178 domain-containing protein [Inhella sp.]|uniref:DUF4178 domain-containing protein n=1 Tax=Inhella sp. TaxID=1921806 RepID=UPI0035B3217D